MKVILLSAVLVLGIGATAPADAQPIEVFDRVPVFFAPDTTFTETDSITHEDNGRIAVRTVVIPELKTPTRITAIVTVYPQPKDEVSVFDPWDRAGHIRMSTETDTDIELVKFVTAYGGLTEYEVDLTHLAPLLRGHCKMKAFVDTWLNPAWEIDFSLHFEPDTIVAVPIFAAPVFFDQSFVRPQADSGGVNGSVTIPDDVKRAKLYYFVSGHCTDGRGADEFEPKDNVLSVDNTVVFRYQPWRDDCRDFRGINPYTRRWSDGWWSSDYSRSGWCPGDMVDPLVLDLTDHLTPGDHTVNCMIENIRPSDEDKNHGYWRVSAYVVGWQEK